MEKKSKIAAGISGKMPKVYRRISKKILMYSVDERIFAKSKDRSDMIPGKIVKNMIVPFVSCFSTVESTRTSMTDPGLFSMRKKVYTCTCIAYF